MWVLGPSYERRQSEKTQLYRIIAANWEMFLQERADEGRDGPKLKGSPIEKSRTW